MAIYKTRWFARWARKEGLSDKALWGAVDEMVQGLFEADRATGGRKTGRLPHAGCDQPRQPLDICLWLCQERAQQHRSG